MLNRLLSAKNLTKEQIKSFLSIRFSHHCEIIAKAKSLEERIFYLELCATEFWSKEKLRYKLTSDLYSKRWKIPNNFNSTITNEDLRRKAVLSFKDEYLLDFINIEDPDELNERILENKIVLHIKKFIMTLGSDFSFLGNQYRLEVDEKEFFIDLLFFNRSKPFKLTSALGLSSKCRHIFRQYPVYLVLYPVLPLLHFFE